MVTSPEAANRLEIVVSDLTGMLDDLGCIKRETGGTGTAVFDSSRGTRTLIIVVLPTQLDTYFILPDTGFTAVFLEDDETPHSITSSTKERLRKALQEILPKGTPIPSTEPEEGSPQVTDVT